MKKESNILIACVLLWCLGIVAAPLFSGTWLSNLLYRFYSVVCHQFDSRSFRLHDEPFAVCIRCTSIYAGFLSASIVLRLSSRLRSKNFSSLPLLFIASFPMLIDGTCFLLNVHESTTLTRTVTGSIFGIGMALLLHRALTDIIHSPFTKRTKRYEPETG